MPAACMSKLMALHAAEETQKPIGDMYVCGKPQSFYLCNTNKHNSTLHTNYRLNGAGIMRKKVI